MEKLSRILHDLDQGNIDVTESKKLILELLEPVFWIKYDFKDIKSRPPEYNKYLIRRKDGKIHWEVWNGSGWAYNGNVITHYMMIREPLDI